MVIAKMMPLKLLVDIEKANHDTRRGIDLSNPAQIVDVAMDKWQQDGSNSNKRRWSYRLKPSTGEGTKRKSRADELLPDTDVNRPWTFKKISVSKVTM